MSRKPTKKAGAPAQAPIAEPAEVEPEESKASRPTLEELQSVELVEVTYLLGDGPVLVAGIGVSSTPKVVSVDYVRKQGSSHLRALALDESIAVKVVK